MRLHIAQPVIDVLRHQVKPLLHVAEAFFQHIEAGEDLAILVTLDGIFLHVLVEPARKVGCRLLAEGLLHTWWEGRGHGFERGSRTKEEM